MTNSWGRKGEKKFLLILKSQQIQEKYLVANLHFSLYLLMHNIRYMVK